MGSKRKTQDPPDSIAKKRKSAHKGASSSTKPTPPLLALPPELRNRIYEYAIVENFRIKVTPNLHPPSLLRVSRQIRHETKGIWLGQNNFKITIRDCDVSLTKKFMNRLPWASSAAENGGILVRVRGRACWGNLMGWCKDVYHGEIYTPGAWASRNGYRQVIAAALRIAAVEEGMSWKACEKALEQLRRVAGFLDEEWLED